MDCRRWVFDPQSGEALMNVAHKLGLEDVIAVRGRVRVAPDNSVNRDYGNGDEVEVLATELES
jgi:aspartyl-tRNA synthetase